MTDALLIGLSVMIDASRGSMVDSYFFKSFVAKGAAKMLRRFGVDSFRY